MTIDYATLSFEQTANMGLEDYADLLLDPLAIVANAICEAVEVFNQTLALKVFGQTLATAMLQQTQTVEVI